MSRTFLTRDLRHIRVRLGCIILAILLCMGTTGSSLCAENQNFLPAAATEESQPASDESTSDATTSDATTSDATPSDATPSDADSVPVISEMDISAQGTLVVGAGRGMIFYQKSPDTQMNIPAASKLMTAVIALESLALDTQITISSEVEKVDDNAENSLYLSKGEKCTVKYLVAAILYRDSDAAALSLAEYISIDESSFVVRMNEMAKSLGMNRTVYANTSGDPAYLTADDASSPMNYSPVDLQYTTLSDMSSLFRYSLNMESFKQIFTEYRTLVFLADGSPQIVTSTMITAWGLSSSVKGAARFSSRNMDDTSCVLAFAGTDDFAIAVLLVGVRNDAIYKDLITAMDTTFAAFEVSALVSIGDKYRKISLEGIAQPVSSVFNNTILYVHPIGDDYIQPDTEFIPSTTVSLPIRQGELLGQVVFTLDDGTQIVTEVVSEADVWAKTTFVSDTIEMFQAHRNLTAIIGISILFFLISAAWAIYSSLSRYLRARRRRNIR